MTPEPLDQTLIVSPSNVISVVTSACGNFSSSYCDGLNSMSVVQSYCLGQNSCTVPATNAVFGDPCPGVNKQLAVQASYSFASNEPQNTLMRHDAFTIYEGTPVLQQISPDTAHIGNNISVTISGEVPHVTID